MLTLIAQTTQHTPPSGFDNWIANAFYILGLITAAVMLFKNVRKTPSQNVRVEEQPLNVREYVEYTPISMHQEFAKAVNERFASMSAASSAGREKIYNLIRTENTAMQNRFTELVGLVREIKGKIERNTNPPHSS
jgi:hypothetical protein